MPRQVLVTGAGGFIGRHVAKRWANEGCRVVGIGHGNWSSEQARSWGIEAWHAADVTLETLTAYADAPEVIVHCAGSSSVTYSITNPYQDFQRTTQTAMEVLEYARLYAPAARLVLLSSAAVYGHVIRLPIVETDLSNPISPYGMHKYIAEKLFRSYADRFQISVSIVRFFSVYGSGLRKQLLWDACEKLRRGLTSFSGTGEERRDWLHVDDAADLIVKAAGHASTLCDIVNGGSGISHSVRDILQLVVSEFPASQSSVSFSGAVRTGDPPGYEADIAKAMRWGWIPRTSLDAGITAYVDWYKKGAT